MKRIILGLAALVMGASLVSCRIRPLFAPHTEHKKIDYREVNEHRTLRR
ncbi:MAG: hypothetical protein IKG98_08410 [Ruminococcus sp.]|nr:hypothetical protein [Ruminococcus sp.]